MKKKFWEYIKSNFKNDKWYLIISFFIIYLMTLKYNLNEDYGYYHLPYIINLTSKKLFLDYQTCKLTSHELVLAEFFSHVKFTIFRFKIYSIVQLNFIIFL